MKPRLKSAQHKDWKSHLLTAVCRARSDQPAELPVAAAAPLGGVGNSAYSPLCCLALNRISRLQTARVRADESHFPAVAQTVGFGLGRSKMHYLSTGVD